MVFHSHLAGLFQNRSLRFLPFPYWAMKLIGTIYNPCMANRERSGHALWGGLISWPLLWSLVQRNSKDFLQMLPRSVCCPPMWHSLEWHTPHLLTDLPERQSWGSWLICPDLKLHSTPNMTYLREGLSFPAPLPTSGRGDLVKGGTCFDPALGVRT